MDDRQTDYRRLIAPVERRMVRAMWRIVRNGSDADEAMQNARIAIWSQWNKVVAHANPQALMLTMAINAAYDVLRKRRRFAWLEKEPPSCEVPDGASSAFDTLADRQACDAVMNAIAALSRNQGRAILMHVVEEMPYPDIAAAMDCSEVTVRKHVARARAKLREKLADVLAPTFVRGGCHDRH